MISNRKLHRAVRLTLGVASGALLASYVPVGLAQDSAMGEVVVTGSRIARPDLDSASPVTILNNETIETSGVTDIGDLLQSIPSMSGSPIGTTTNNGGNGSVLIDLRGMGVDRTLTLVNGKRTVDGGDYQTIPQNMIERVEILKDGGASVYGADAVAGVVNIITRSGFDGLEFSAQTADYFDMDSGVQNVFGMIGGKTFDGGHFTFGAEYVDQEEAYQSDAPWDFFQNSYYIYPEGCENQVAAPYDGTPSGGCYPIGSSRIPEGRLNTARLAQRFYSAGNPRLFDYFNGVYNRVGGVASGAPDPNFDPAYAIPTFNNPYVLMNPDGSGLVPYDGRTYNYAPVNYIQTPYERTNVYADGRFALTDSINFSGSIRGNFRESAQELAPQPYNSPTDPAYQGTWTRIDPLTGLPLREFQTTNADGDTVYAYTANQSIGRVVAPISYSGISEDNYYNTTGYPITDARRRIQEIDRRFTQDITQYQVNVGLDGEFGNNIKWDVYYNFGYRSRHDHDFGQWSGPRLANALGPSADLDDDGTPECYQDVSDPSTLIVGCVPLNLMGGPMTITQDQLDYVGIDLTDTYKTTQDEAAVSFSGSLWELPAGKMGWAAGYAYGKADFEYQPDSAKQNDSVTGNTGAGTKGSLQNDSFFVEFFLPLFDNDNQSLDAKLSGRHDSYDVFDAETTYAVGVEFNAMKDLKLRATYGTVFRAPTISDLFGGQVDSFPTYNDPCIPDAGDPLPPGCAQVGVQLDNQLLSRVGGNPELAPETGDTFTAGVVWTPHFGSGDMSVTVDYWQIAIEDGISSLGVQFILDDCYLNESPESCALVFRAPDYSIDHVNDFPLNVADQGAKGIDTEVRYSWDTEIGRFSAEVLWSHNLERTKTPFQGAEEQDLSGRFTDPTAQDGGAYAEDKMNYALKWFWNDLLIGYDGEFISSLVADTFCNCGAGNQPDGTYKQKIDSQLYHDLFAQYKFSSGTKITAGVTNLTDEAPPYIEIGFNATTDPATYRMFGRGYFLRLAHSFE